MRKTNYTVGRRTELNRHLTDTYYMEWRWTTLTNLRETSYSVWRVTHGNRFINWGDIRIGSGSSSLWDVLTDWGWILCTLHKFQVKVTDILSDGDALYQWRCTYQTLKTAEKLHVSQVDVIYSLSAAVTVHGLEVKRVWLIISLRCITRTAGDVIHSLFDADWLL
jgi:hypothetical protein